MKTKGLCFYMILLILFVVLSTFLMTGCSANEVPQISTTTDTSAPTHSPSPSSTPTFTATATPTATFTPTSSNTPSPSPTPTNFGGGDGIFTNISTGKTQAEFKKLGIYKIDLFTKNYQQIASPEFDMIGISPDYQDVLALKYPHKDITELFVIHVNDGKVSEVASNVFGGFGQSAYWYENGLIAFVGWEQGSKYVFTVHPDGSGQKKLSENKIRPLRINPSSINIGVCVSGGSYIIYSNGDSSQSIQENWCLPFDGSDPINIKIASSVKFSPQEGYLAYGRFNNSDLAIVSPTGITFYTGPGNRTAKEIMVIPGQWSPDGNMLLADVRYCISDGITPCDIELTVISKDGTFLDAPLCEGIRGTYAWSPDGTQLFMLNYQTNLDPIHYLYNLTTKECTNITEFLPEGWSLGYAIWGNRYLH